MNGPGNPEERSRRPDRRIGAVTSSSGRRTPAPRSAGADAAAEAVTPATPADLEDALARRLRTEPGPLLRRRAAVVRLDAGPAGAWRVVLGRGRPLTWMRDDPPVGRATTTVRGDLRTLISLVDGRESGVKAFLDGRITMRGDLGLALALDGVFLHDERPEEWARTGLVDVVAGRRTIPTSVISAGSADKPPVILLHGLGATAASLLPLLDALSDDYLVHAPDMPGFGDSGKPRAAYDPEFFATWVLGLMDALGHETVTIVGNSLGGRVALEVGLRAPERVSALVLLCPSAAWRRVRQLVPVVRLLRPELLSLFPWAPRPTRGIVVEIMRMMFSVPERLPRAWYDAAADEAVRVMRQPAARRAFTAAIRQIYLEEADGERGFWTRLTGLRPPALFVWGDRDRLVPSSFARHVAAALPFAGSVIFEDSGHVPQFEHPEETAEVVRGFLGAAGALGRARPAAATRKTS